MSIFNAAPSEREKFNFERRKHTWGIVKWFVVSVAISSAGLFIEQGFKERYTGIQEMQAFDKYVEPVFHIDNWEERWRLSEFYSIVTPTDRLRERWEDYHKHLKKERDSMVNLKQEKEVIIKSGNKTKEATRRLQEINQQLEQFNRKLLPDNIPKKNESVVYEGEPAGEVKLRKQAEVIKNKIEAGNYYSLVDYFDNAEKANMQAVKDVIETLGIHFGDINSGFTRDYDHAIYSCRYGVASLLNQSKVIMPAFKAEFSKDSVYLSIGLDDEKKEELSLSLQGIDWNRVYNFVKQFFIARLSRFE
jgi:hypothetical protein